MESQSTKPTITFTLEYEEARDLFAFLTSDESIPWGISNGRRVSFEIETKLREFLKKK